MAQVLVAEDEPAISLMLEDVLTEAGYSVPDPFARGAAALDWLRDHTPDLAILDVQLADGSCIEVARLLQRRGVPLLFFSGHILRMGLPADLRGLPWLAKPARSADILGMLRSLEPTGRSTEADGNLRHARAQEGLLASSPSSLITHKGAIIPEPCPLTTSLASCQSLMLQPC
jgi:DNA-binding response OmpR family regulator